MPQFTYPFKYEEKTRASSLTGLAGLPLYLELLQALNLVHSMFKRLCCEAHWQNSRLQGIRFHTIIMPVRVLERGRQR